jgi:3-oxoacyl-[acyl-carrier-protein] synthase-3
MTKPIRPQCRVLGTGCAVPEQVLTNAHLERLVDTNDEWITDRTGIKERRIMRRGEKCSDYCIRAARNALESAGLAGSDIDLIIIGTISGDLRFPSTAQKVQSAIGAKHCTSWDVSATCSGFLFALTQADAFFATGRATNAIVIGAEMLTPMVDWTDRATCVLFGDGAGAVVLTKSHDERGVLSTYIGSSTDQWELLFAIGQGTAGSFSNGALPDGERFLRMNGNEVFRFAVRTMGKAAVEATARAGLTPEQIDWLIPHQANTRIIDATAERLKMPKEKVFVNIEKYGNTSSASVPIALDEARRSGTIRDGQNVLSVAFGGGFTWGGAVIRF